MDTVSPLETVSPSQARTYFPRGRGGAFPATQTVIGWIEDGARVPGGGRLRLRAVRCGAGWRTCRSWVEEFLTALTAAHLSRGPAPAAVGQLGNANDQPAAV